MKTVKLEELVSISNKEAVEDIPVNLDVISTSSDSELDKSSISFYKRMKEKYESFPRLPLIHINPKDSKYSIMKLALSKKALANHFESVERGFFKRLRNWERHQEEFHPEVFQSYMDTFHSHVNKEIK
jgi:hypothetical protein